MNAIKTIDETGSELSAASAPALDAFTAAILAAYQNPNIDVDKLGKLMDLSERAQKKANRIAFDVAFAKMQQELPVIDERGGIKNKDGAVQSTYAKWSDVSEAITPILGRHGFSLKFRSSQEGQIITITATLSREGCFDETSLNLAPDSSGSKNTVQAVGSAIQYGKRYTGGMLLNLTSRFDIDDGGVAAGAPLTISFEQVCALEAKIVEATANKDAFLKAIKVENLSMLPTAHFDAAMAKLDQKINKAPKKDAAK